MKKSESLPPRCLQLCKLLDRLPARTERPGYCDEAAYGGSSPCGDFAAGLFPSVPRSLGNPPYSWFTDIVSQEFIHYLFPGDDLDATRDKMAGTLRTLDNQKITPLPVMPRNVPKFRV